MITIEEVLEKVKNKDCSYFYDLYCESYRNRDINVVYDQHYGDGNEYNIAIEFKELDLIVLLEGTYSSWDSPYWDDVSFAEPFEYTETRYKPVTLEYLRDKKIESILKEDKN